MIVTGYFVKPLSDYRRRLPEFGVDVIPDFVVDDHASVVEAFGGFHIPDVALEGDRALAQVVEAVRLLASAPANA